MFQIETTESASEKKIVDENRKARLEFVASLGREPGSAFKLIWDERVIPFEALREHQQDSDTGQEYYRTHFLTFGYSSKVELRQGIGGYRFADLQEREEAQVLAIEALLLFGSHYDGDRHPEGYDRIEFDGRMYTKRDFGLS